MYYFFLSTIQLLNTDVRNEVGVRSKVVRIILKNCMVALYVVAIKEQSNFSRFVLWLSSIHFNNYEMVICSISFKRL